VDVTGIEVDFVSGHVGRGRCPSLIVVPCHVILRLGLFEHVLHPISELVDCFYLGRRLVRFEAHPRVAAGVKEERGVLRRRVDMIVVGELGEGQEGVPVVLSFPDEDPYVLFKLLVDPFSLPVHLWMIGGGRGGFDSEQLVEFLHEEGYKLGSAIRDHSSGEAMKFPDITQVEIGGAGGRNSSDGLDKVGSFTGGVYDHHDCVVPSRLGELDDEIDTGCIPAAFRDREGLEFSCREAAGDFGVEAEVTGRDVLADIAGHVGPPIIPGHELQSLELAGMACDLGVVAKGDDAAVEVGGGWHVDAPMEVQESVTVRPF